MSASQPSGPATSAMHGHRRQRPWQLAEPPRLVGPVDDLRPWSDRASGGVSRLDRATLHLGVLVAAVIAGCSYAVSATSLYALGRHAGYCWWQAAAVPVVADGPAIYGMVRIVSRSCRDANGAGYGWLLVVAGTAASIAGNVAHAQPGAVARGIAAAVPLAVLAMLEALKGDAQQVARLATASRPVAPPDGLGAGSVQQADGPVRLTVRRVDAEDASDRRPDGVDGRTVRAVAAASTPVDAGVQQRLGATFQQGRPDGAAWKSRTLAQAAGCGHSTAAAFLRTRRQQQARREGAS